MQKGMVKILHCICSLRCIPAPPPPLILWISVLFIYQHSFNNWINTIAANHNALSLCTHRMCMWPKLAQLESLREWLTNREGGSLFTWDQDPEEAICLDHFSYCAEATWGQTQRKERWKEDTASALALATPEASNPCTSQVREPDNTPFYYHVIELANEIITNIPNWRFPPKNHISPNHPLLLAHLIKLRRVLDLKQTQPTINMYKVSFGDVEKVPKLDNGYDCTTLWMYLRPLNCTL